MLNLTSNCDYVKAQNRMVSSKVKS